MVSDIRRLAAAASVLFLGLVPAAGAAQTADLADLCAENGAGPVTENTLILRTAEAIPSSCTIDLVHASLRIVGAEIATTALAIFRTGSGTVEITNSTIEAEGAFSITDGAGRVRITDSSLSGSNNSDIDVSGDIHIRHSALSLETGASAAFLTLATDAGTLDVAASRLSAQADSFGLITLITPERLSLRSSELIAELVELIPQSGADLAFGNNHVSAASPNSGGPAVVSVVSVSDPGAVTVVANTFAGGATFQFAPGVQADRCTIRANDPPDAVVGAEDACP